jgi:hypothetical protein
MMPIRVRSCRRLYIAVEQPSMMPIRVRSCRRLYIAVEQPTLMPICVRSCRRVGHVVCWLRRTMTPEQTPTTAPVWVFCNCRLVNGWRGLGRVGGASAE